MIFVRLVWGAVAGLAATVPMTWAMNHMQRHLPPQEQYPLPPVEIVDSMLDQLGLKPNITPRREKVLIVLGHYGYGALGGAAYAALTPGSAFQPLARGVGFGLLLWVSSYLGWLPLLHILRPATRHPRERNVLMLTAHVLWGGVTGMLAARRE